MQNFGCKSDNTNSESISLQKCRVNSAPDVLFTVIKSARYRQNKPSTVRNKMTGNSNKNSNISNSNNKSDRYQNYSQFNQHPPPLPMNEKKSSQSSLFISRYFGNKLNSSSNNISQICSSRNSEHYLSLPRTISLVSGRRLSAMEEQREKFETQFCRLNVLLITMQIGLGFSMTGLGVYLRSLSPSLTWKDCTYWAGLPLLITGACGIYFCLPDSEIRRRTRLSRLVRVTCALLSIVTTGLTATASIMSGSHGKWISDFSSTCDLHFITEHSPNAQFPEKCCEDENNSKSSLQIDSHTRSFGLLLNETFCVCKVAPNGNFSLLHYQRQYNFITCRYVFSALKDYFILQSSLMGVAAGVSLWMAIIQVRTTTSDVPSSVPHSPIMHQSVSASNRTKRASFLSLLKTSICATKNDNHKSNVICSNQTSREESPSPNFLRYVTMYNNNNINNRSNHNTSSCNNCNTDYSINNNINTHANYIPLNSDAQIPRVIIHKPNDIVKTSANTTPFTYFCPYQFNDNSVLPLPTSIQPVSESCHKFNQILSAAL